MKGPPLWLALLGLIGNSAVAAVLFERGENRLWPIFVVAIVISFGACLRAAKSTAVRTAEKGSTDAKPSA